MLNSIAHLGRREPGTGSNPRMSMAGAASRVFLARLLLSLICAVYLFFVLFNLFESNGEDRTISNAEYRLAMLIPFVSETSAGVPPYFHLFCSSAAGSAPLVDFLVFHNGVLTETDTLNCPANVKLVSLESVENFSALVARILDEKQNDEISLGSRDQFVKVLSRHIIRYPYVLVELKPALGHIFADYIREYTHWGYTDLDIIFGDLPRWITKDELEMFDVVTYGYGDQDRLYLRGQFTFHKNQERINQMWRGCDYLSDMDERFASILKKETEFHFESAEGCYSAELLKQPNIRVKYAVKAFTDVSDADIVNSFGVFISTGARRDRSVVYKVEDASSFLATYKVANTWFESADELYSHKEYPIQRETGPLVEVPFIHDRHSKCMYWAQKRYQASICNKNIGSQDSAFLIDGKLYKQKYEMIELPKGIVSAPFFHFQEWKRFFRNSQLSSFSRSHGVGSFLLGRDGLIPILGSEAGQVDEMSNGDLDFRLPNHTYCLISGPRTFPSSPKAPECFLSTSWHDKTIGKLFSVPDWTSVEQDDVTLTMTLQLMGREDSVVGLRRHLEVIRMNLERWKSQPSVLVIEAPSTSQSLEQGLDDVLSSLSSVSKGGTSCLIKIIYRKGGSPASQKALKNMAVDGAPTRWLISGLEVENGSMVSQEMLFFTKRVVRGLRNEPGHIFLVPQFQVSRPDFSFSLASLFHEWREGGVQEAAALGAKTCSVEDTDSFFEDINQIWWWLSEQYVSQEPQHGSFGNLEHPGSAVNIAIADRLARLDRLQLPSTTSSPIVLSDRLGPIQGLVTPEAVREVEEFDGCQNFLRIVQMAVMGYSMNVMAGAFVASVDNRLNAGSGCETCRFFDKDHISIVQDIVRNEGTRPAKAALLWEAAAVL